MPSISLLSDLEDLSQVSLVDIELAKALWVQRVPFKWKTLLDSGTIGVHDPLRTPYAWDAQNRRYIHLASRKYVPYSEIRDEAIEPLIVLSRTAQRNLSTQLQTRDISFIEWQKSMIDQIKQSQIAVSLAANGGDENSSQVDYKKIAAEILALLILFRGFSKDIVSGKQPLNGRLLLRSDLYASAARSSFEEIRRFGMMTYFGAMQEKRELGKAEHCRSDGELEGCVELHDKGWVPINTLPKLGKTPCRTNCKCRFIYRYLNDVGSWIIVDDSKTVAVILNQLKVRIRGRN